MEGEGYYEHRGLLPRSIEQIVDICSKSNSIYSVKLASVQIYNDHIYDLSSSPESSPKLKIRETSDNDITIESLQYHQIPSFKQAQNLLNKFQTNRMIASTHCNKVSSRSHCIYFIEISKNEKFIGKLILVDLAGSERLKSILKII